MGATASISQNRGSRRKVHVLNEPTVELAPGFSVTQSEVKMMVDLVANEEGKVSVSRLSEYLSSEGLEASEDDVKEMLRMLPSSWVSIADVQSIASEEQEANTYGVDYSYETDTYTAEEPYVPKIYHDVDSAPRKLQELVWKHFLNRAFAVGDMALQEHVLEASAVEQREVYVFIAIPSLTFLDLITSASDSAFNDDDDGDRHLDYIQFGEGAAVSLETCPGEWKGPLKDMLAARLDLHQSQRTDPTLTERLKLALAADPDEGISFDDRDVDGPINRIRGLLQSAATAITQTSQFRDTFETVLDLLEAVSSPLS
jgi:hypothetical protein